MFRTRNYFRAKNRNVYVVAAMLSAERKSAVSKALFAPVYAAERRAIELAAAEIAEKTAEKAVLDARMKKKSEGRLPLQGSGSVELPPEPPRAVAAIEGQ